MTRRWASRGWFSRASRYSGHIVDGVFDPDAQPAMRLGLGLGRVLLYCSAVFYLNGHRRGSLAFQVLGLALALWAALIGVGQMQSPWGEVWAASAACLGPVPQMLLGIAMVMVLFENQRNSVQENTLALSTLGVDPRQLLAAGDLVPNMQAALERLMSALPCGARPSALPNAGAGCCLRCSRVFRRIPAELWRRAEPATTSARLPTGRAESLPSTMLAQMTEPLLAGPVGTVRGV